MSDFFLSYSSDDNDIANAIVKAIESVGYSVWKDKNEIKGGDNFAETIQKSLKNAKCLIVLVSKNSVNSKWVKCEITEAIDNKIRIIPIILDDTKPSILHIQLNNMHHVVMRDWKQGSTLSNDLLKALKEQYAEENVIKSVNIISRKNTVYSLNNPSRRKFIALTAVGAGGIAAAGAGSIATSYSILPQVKWKMNNVVSEVNGFPKESFLVKVGELLCEKISELTEGRFSIEKTSVNKELKHKPLTLLQDENNHQDCTYSSVYFQDLEDESATYRSLYFRYAIPFGLSPEGQMAWLFEQNKDGKGRKRKDLFDDTLKKNFISIPLATTGFQAGIWSNKEINTTKDINGLKIRLSGIAAEVFKKFGADVQKINISDLNKLLKEGKIDAAEWLAFEDDVGFLKLNEVAKYFYYPAWWEPSTTFDLHIKKTSWDELGKESQLYQKLLEYACSELYIASWSHYVMTNCELLEKKDKWEKTPVFKTFSTNIIDESREMTKKILDEYSASNSEFKAIYEEWKGTKNKLDRWARFTKGSPEFISDPKG